MSVSDDESFVILGTSPEPSLNQNSLAVDSVVNLKIGESPKLGAFVNNTNTCSVLQDDSSLKSSLNGKGKSIVGTSSSSSNNASLATSFILGEVTPAEMKASVFSQFPSLQTMDARMEDVAKLQSILDDQVELKDILRKTNSVISQYFVTANKWQDDLKKKELEYGQQMKDLQDLTAKLRNENLELKKELESKIEHMAISEDIMKRENREMSNLMSEKSAQILNMALQIEKLEQQQLNSFEFVKKNVEDTSLHANYVPVLEHKRVVKELERKMSALLAENLELKDMQKQYIDEITCLKVNLVSVEELCKKSQSDICILQSRDTEKGSQFNSYEQKIECLTQEIELLKAQVDIYSKDFQIERAAREALAGDKDQLLADLKTLQRRNHQLIEEAQAKLEMYTQTPSSSGGPKGTFKRAPETAEPANKVESITAQPKEEQIYKVSNFICPLCDISLKSLAALQTHVNSCLSD